MEPKDEPKKLIEKQNEEDKTIHNDETPINSTENSPKNIKSKSNNQYNKLELIYDLAQKMYYLVKDYHL